MTVCFLHIALFNRDPTEISSDAEHCRAITTWSQWTPIGKSIWSLCSAAILSFNFPRAIGFMNIESGQFRYSSNSPFLFVNAHEFCFNKASNLLSDPTGWVVAKHETPFWPSGAVQALTQNLFLLLSKRLSWTVGGPGASFALNCWETTYHSLKLFCWTEKHRTSELAQTLHLPSNCRIFASFCPQNLRHRRPPPWKTALFTAYCRSGSQLCPRAHGRSLWCSWWITRSQQI